LLASAVTNFSSAGFSAAANVVTSVPFLVLGLAGLLRLHIARGRTRTPPDLALVVFLLSLVMVGMGSVFYHWSPSTDHLLWDRLPIAVCLAAFACAMANVYSESRMGGVLLVPAVLVAVSSVLYWHVSWARGHEDLRPYIAVQVCSAMWAGLVVFSRPAQNAGIAGLRLALIAYTAARISELFQQQIYNASGVDLGHPLKHLLVAFAAFMVLRSLAQASGQTRELPVLQLEPASGD
jgi:predicted membrane channel-forming protein YqfA (hemolysin III family)